MLSDADQMKELELEVERLHSDVERYRNACYDAMQQLSWCIGWFAGNHKPSYAASLGNNLAYIRRAVLNRAPEAVPLAQDR